jgi:hypothetical protein
MRHSFLPDLTPKTTDQFKTYQQLQTIDEVAPRRSILLKQNSKFNSPAVNNERTNFFFVKRRTEDFYNRSLSRSTSKAIEVETNALTKSNTIKNPKLAQITIKYEKKMEELTEYIKENDYDFLDFRKNSMKARIVRNSNAEINKISQFTSKNRQKHKSEDINNVKIEKSHPTKNEHNFKVKNNYDFNLEFDGNTINIINFLLNQKYSISLRDFFLKITRFFLFFYQDSSASVEELTYKFKNLLDYEADQYQDVINKIFLTNSQLINTNFKVNKLYRYMEDNYQIKNFKRLLLFKDQIGGKCDKSKNNSSHSKIIQTRNFNFKKEVISQTVFFDSKHRRQKLSNVLKMDSFSRPSHTHSKALQKPTTIVDFLKSLYNISNRLVDHYYKNKFDQIKTCVEKGSSLIDKIDNLSTFVLIPGQKYTKTEASPKHKTPQKSMMRIKNLNLPNQDISSFNQLLNRHHNVLTENCHSYLRIFKKSMI